MARVEGAEIVWTSADMTALQQDKDRLQELIDQIPSNPTAELRTEFQDPCPAFVRWTVATSNDNQNLEALRALRAPTKGKEKPRKR
jgi:hypothetical protein